MIFVAFAVWLLSLVAPVHACEGECWVPYEPSPPLPPQVHFCTVVSPTLVVCA